MVKRGAVFLKSRGAEVYIVLRLQLLSYKWAAAEVVAPDSWSKSDLVRGVCPNPRHNWSQCPWQHCSSVSRCAEEKLKLVTRDKIRASNEGLRRFHNHEEGPYLNLLLVESAYYRYHI